MNFLKSHITNICLTILSFSSIYGQERIQMVEYKGVYCIPCTVNGKNINMIFDTGAAMVSISQILAESMLQERKLSINDFDNPQYAVLADGSIIESATVNIKSIKIGSKEIKNIKAVVVNNPAAMLLFGQSAIQQIGEYSIKGDILTLYEQPNTHLGAINKWDSKNQKYISSTYGFQWKLPVGADGLIWEQKKGNQKHTVFGANCGPFSIHVNAQVTNAIDVDVWTQYEKLKIAFSYTDELVSKQTGCKTIRSNLKRYSHKSGKCLKREFVYSFKINNQPYEEYNEALIFIHNNYIIQVVVSINNEFLEQFPSDIKLVINEIFSGFVLTNMQETSK